MKKVLIVLIVAVAATSAYIYTRPAEFSIARTAAVGAVPAVVFGHVNDLHQWQAWSPWARMDPSAKSTFSGPPAGVGASMAWAGNNKVGEGKMTITESVPNQRIMLKLEFYKPFAATNMTEFSLQPHGTMTVVTWQMSGHNNFIGKAMSLVMDCDKMVGGEFEKGLANLNMLVTKHI